jgi:hypothetical protein
MSLAFRFNARDHEYLDVETGELFPHITGMLELAGLIDDRWYTEESALRGTSVHRLTADYDLGSLDVESCTSIFRGFLLAHVAVVGIMTPTWLGVEEPLVHPTLRFGGRPDRDCLVNGIRSVWEVKSGPPEPAHRVQTALQAILVAHEAQLPADTIGRFCCYLTGEGKYKLQEHRERTDFDRAYRIIHETTMKGRL